VAAQEVGDRCNSQCRPQGVEIPNHCSVPRNAHGRTVGQARLLPVIEARAILYWSPLVVQILESLHRYARQVKLPPVSSRPYTASFR
jgi:hypothetical protein